MRSPPTENKSPHSMTKDFTSTMFHKIGALTLLVAAKTVSLFCASNRS
jgi:hypothetical protein